MSTPVPSPSLHPTRRQLDELDALMERMLELPVNPAENETRGPATEGAAAVIESAFADFSSQGIPSYQTEEEDAAASDTISPIDGQMPFRFQESASLTVNRAKANKTAAVATSAGAADDGPPPPLWLWPVARINQIYDTLMGGLGGPGRVMRGTGRTVLGWIGLLMLVAALAWGVLDWLHWAG